MLSKAVRSFAKNMLTDEKYIEKKGAAYINVWIRKIHLTGKVGEVEPDVNESFPISWAQKRDMILQLFQAGNEDIMAVLRHPENAGLVAMIIGVPELYIPGDDDRNKQLIEISELILSEPIMAQTPMGGPQVPEDGPPSVPPEEEGGPPKENEAVGGMPPMTSSIPVEESLDNHEVEAGTCAAWLKSEIGLQYKKENPGAYLNVLLHFQEHAVLAAQQMKAEQEAQAKEEEKEGGPPSKSGEE